MSRTCSRWFLNLGGITLESDLNLMLSLLWKLWELFIGLILFQHISLMLRWLLIYQRLKKLLSLWSITKSTRERAKSLPFFLYLLLTLRVRYFLFHRLPSSQSYDNSSSLTTCPGSAMIPSPAMTISKTIKFQMVSSPRFFSVVSDKGFLCLLQLKEVFSNLP